MFDLRNAIIRAGARLFTAEEIYQIGYQHGTDGIAHYPPSRWGADDNQRGGTYNQQAQSEYDRGYRDGRIAWRTMFGSYPKSGSAHLDTKES